MALHLPKAQAEPRGGIFHCCCNDYQFQLLKCVVWPEEGSSEVGANFSARPSPLGSCSLPTPSPQPLPSLDVNRCKQRCCTCSREALPLALASLPSCSVPKSERTTVHKNLIFALAAAEALLMFSELAKTNQVGRGGNSRALLTPPTAAAAQTTWKTKSRDLPMGDRAPQMPSCSPLPLGGRGGQAVQPFQSSPWPDDPCPLPEPSPLPPARECALLSQPSSISSSWLPLPGCWWKGFSSGAKWLL